MGGCLDLLHFIKYFSVLKACSDDCLKLFSTLPAGSELLLKVGYDYPFLYILNSNLWFLCFSTNMKTPWGSSCAVGLLKNFPLHLP